MIRSLLILLALVAVCQRGAAQSPPSANDIVAKALAEAKADRAAHPEEYTPAKIAERKAWASSPVGRAFNKCIEAGRNAITCKIEADKAKPTEAEMAAATNVPPNIERVWGVAHSCGKGWTKQCLKAVSDECNDPGYGTSLRTTCMHNFGVPGF